MYCVMPNLRQPSRLVVLRRSSIWKKGTGEEESVCGGPPGRDSTTCSTDHGVWVLEPLRRPGEGREVSRVLTCCLTVDWVAQKYLQGCVV